MQIQILKSKLHCAMLTANDLHYQGSIAIDLDILDEANILPYEKVLVVNQNNGQRLETYAIAAERGSKVFCLNGAAARLGMAGDLVTIMCFAIMSPEEAKNHKAKVIVFSENNRASC